eukprot:4265732-Ditylum_brightwellii.AAC.1
MGVRALQQPNPQPMIIVSESWSGWRDLLVTRGYNNVITATNREWGDSELNWIKKQVAGGWMCLLAGASK